MNFITREDFNRLEDRLLERINKLEAENEVLRMLISEEEKKRVAQSTREAMEKEFARRREEERAERKKELRDWVRPLVVGVGVFALNQIVTYLMK